jgi:Predicted UDP-glucose 6-dehydrogenase
MQCTVSRTASMRTEINISGYVFVTKICVTQSTHSELFMSLADAYLGTQVSFMDGYSRRIGAEVYI